MICESIVFLVVIAPREQKEKLKSELHEHKANYMNVMFGHGSLHVSPLSNAFGFVSEPKKVIITAFVHDSKSREIIALLEEKFGFNQANTGFAFTIPIEKMSH